MHTFRRDLFTMGYRLACRCATQWRAEKKPSAKARTINTSSRREALKQLTAFTLTFAAGGTGLLLSGCSSKQKQPLPTYEPDAWPEDAPAVTYDDKDCVVRLALDDEGKIIYGSDGEPMIDGLTTPAIRFNENDPLRFYEIVFEEPVEASRPLDARTARIVGSLAEAREYRRAKNSIKTLSDPAERAAYKKRLEEIATPLNKKDLSDYQTLLTDIQGKTQKALQDGNKENTLHIQTDQAKLDAFNARKKSLAEKTVFNPSLIKMPVLE